MKPHHLSPLLNPQNIAIIGASDKSFSFGQVLFANMLAGQFQGNLYPVNLKHKMVGGLPAVNSVTRIKAPVDLAIVVTPVHSYLNVMQECAKKGIKAILLHKSSAVMSKADKEVFNQAIAFAREKKIRVLGPSFLGMMRPATGLNASTYSCQMYSGGLALVTQSSSLATAIIDWAERKEIGFSSLIAVDEENHDVGMGEVLDFLAYDVATQAVLLQVQNVHDGRRFISGLRALAREKPVVVIKSGISENHIKGNCLGSKLIDSHKVFRSAIERTGALYINTISEIFTSINALANNFKVTDRRLAIISNGIGVGTLAKDRAIKLGVEIASLTEETISQINDSLPMAYTPKEPIDLLDNAPPVRFRHAAQLCIEDKNVDGALVILTPQMGTDHLTTARLMIDLQKQTKKPLYLSWLGESKVTDSYELFSKAHSACFRMPEHAIEAFSTLADYQRNQKLLSQTPSALEKSALPDLELAKSIIEKGLKSYRQVLPEHLAQQLLGIFYSDTPQSVMATTQKQAIGLAQKMSFPVVLKIDTPEFVDNVDWEGYARVAHDQEQVVAAFDELMNLAGKVLPAPAKLYGINIGAQIVKKANHEVMITVVQDPTFGPVISFGESMYLADSKPNHAVALPSLNEFLAQDLIAQTHIGRNSNMPRNRQLMHNKALKQLLIAVSQMVSFFPQVAEICLNPVWIEDRKIVLPSIKIVLQKQVTKQIRRSSHMAIMLYPWYMSLDYQLATGENVTIRPIMPEDAGLLQNLVKNMSEESRYLRYMSNIKQLSQNLLARLTQIDYYREMAFVMVRTDEQGKEQMLGVARYTTEPDEVSCEFAVEVANEWCGKGVAAVLMQKLFIAAKEQGLETMHGEVLKHNDNMKRFVKKMGFSCRPLPEDPELLFVEKNLSTVVDMVAKANLLANRANVLAGKMRDKINKK